MAVLKWMLKLALLPLLLLLILVQWAGIFLTTFSTILTNLLAGLFSLWLWQAGSCSWQTAAKS